MVDRIRWDTVSYLPFYYVFFQFLLLTIFNLQANILTTKDILSNLDGSKKKKWKHAHLEKIKFYCQLVVAPSVVRLVTMHISFIYACLVLLIVPYSKLVRSEINQNINK